MNPLTKINVVEINSRKISNSVRSSREKLSLKNNNKKVVNTMINPAAIKSLPTYLFDLYQVSLLERVFGNLKP